VSDVRSFLVRFISRTGARRVPAINLLMQDAVRLAVVLLIVASHT
jgi:hypothetical protein